MYPFSHPESLHNTHWDAIIVGSGPAGAASAITLARAGAKVLLLEKRKTVKRNLGESIPPVAVELVEHFLGSNTHDISAFSTQTTGNVSCWGNCEPQTSDFYFTSKGYGLCLNRQHFDTALCAQAVNSGACVVFATSFERCQRDQANGIWHVDLNSAAHGQSNCTTSYLLDGTGRNSTVATSLGIKRQYHDPLFAFAQLFFSSNVNENPQHLDDDTYTRIEASTNGWWYSNKLPSYSRPQDLSTNTNKESNIGKGSERLVVFHCDKDSVHSKQAATSNGFMRLLEQQAPHIKTYLDNTNYQPKGRIQGAAAGSERLEQFSGDGWLAVGDAAQSYDPLSSQGIHKALSSGSMAAQMVQYALAEKDKNHFFIKRYAQEQLRLWHQYLQQRDHYYASEQRWQNQTFWSRRQGSDIGAPKLFSTGAL